MSRWLIAARGAVLVITFISAASLSSRFRDGLGDPVSVPSRRGSPSQHATNNLVTTGPTTNGVDRDNYSARVRASTYRIGPQTARGLPQVRCGYALARACHRRVSRRHPRALAFSLLRPAFFASSYVPSAYIGSATSRCSCMGPQLIGVRTS